MSQIISSITTRLCQKPKRYDLVKAYIDMTKGFIYGIYLEDTIIYTRKGYYYTDGMYCVVDPLSDIEIKEKEELIKLFTKYIDFKCLDCQNKDLYYGDHVICLLQSYYGSKIYIPCKGKVIGCDNDKVIISHTLLTPVTYHIESVNSNSLFKLPIGSVKTSINIYKLFFDLIKSNYKTEVRKKLIKLAPLEISKKELICGDYLYLFPLFQSTFEDGMYGLYLGDKEVFFENNQIKKANRYLCICLNKKDELYNSLVDRYKCFSYLKKGKSYETNKI